MGIETLTRGAKTLYEERKISLDRGIDKMLFRTSDVDTVSSFLLDRYISAPFALVYRNDNNESTVRHFSPGSGQLITPPRASEKTPIDETLRDQIAVGVEPSAGVMQSIMKNMDAIIGDHSEAHAMTRNKQAIDVLRTGIFYAKGIGGADLGLDINFNRDAANDITNNFAVQTKMTAALKAAQDQLRAKGTPVSQMCVLMGSDWATRFANDAEIIQLRQATAGAMTVASQMIPPELANTEGLYVIDQLRAPNMIAPLWILAYEPPTQYVPTKDATPEPFVPVDEALFFSLTDKTFGVERGVDAFNDSGKAERFAARMVVDTFNTQDPIVTWVRSQTRHALVYGNIDHTLRSTGSNF